MLTCTGETLADQVERLGSQARRRQGDLFGREALQADRRLARARRQPVAGLLGDPQSSPASRVGLENNIFRGKARVFEGEQSLLDALDQDARAVPEQRHDHRALRGAERRAGHAGDARPDLAHHRALPTSAASSSALMTDARFSGGSVGLVIGHVGPEAALGGPIAFVENGDEIVVDLNTNEVNCTALADAAIFQGAQGRLGKGGRRQRRYPPQLR